MAGLVSSMFSSVDLGQRTLDYHLDRHNVLAGNVANLETPGFLPHELLRPSQAVHAGSGLTVSDARHIRHGAASGAEHLSTATEVVVTPGNDGNAVSLERELARVSANHLRYEGVARLVQMQIGTLRYAANDGNG